MKVNIIGGSIPENEIQWYIARAEQHHKGTHTLDIEVDGDFVNLTYHTYPIERIRRITGHPNR